MMGAPNMVAYERNLLYALSCTAHSSCFPAGPRVGIVGALDCMSALPFWTALFDSLGLSVVVSRPSEQDYQWSQSWFAAPSPEVCEPAKQAHAHLAYLLRQKVDVVVVPVFERSNHCAVSSGYGSVLADGWNALANVVDGLPPLVAPLFSAAKPAALMKDPEIVPKLCRLRENICDALTCGSTGGSSRRTKVVRWANAAGTVEDGGELPQSRGSRCWGARAQEDVRSALQRAIGQHRHFQTVLEGETEKALDWIHQDKSRRGLILAGRPYHVNAGGKLHLDEEAQQLGYAVLSLSGLGDKGREAERRHRAQERVHGFWQAKRLARAAMVAADDPQLDLACLVSFGCGYDAVSIEEVRAMMEAAHRPFLVLPMNDSSNFAAAKVRLRTLRTATQHLSDDATSAVGGRIARADWVFAVPDDMCSVAKWMVGEMKRARAEYTQGDSAVAGADDHSEGVVRFLGTEGFVVPDICEACLTEATPFLCGVPNNVAVRYEDSAEFFSKAVSAQIHEACKSQEGKTSALDMQTEKPPLGVMGNPWLVADARANSGIFESIVRAGLTPVPPDFRLLRGEDVSYPLQLRRFCEQGVQNVVYLMPQGCMKGHVQVRGAQGALSRQFPQLKITVIDFGPDSSSLNSRNRVALALAQAKS